MRGVNSALLRSHCKGGGKTCIHTGSRHAYTHTHTHNTTCIQHTHTHKHTCSPLLAQVLPPILFSARCFFRLSSASLSFPCLLIVVRTPLFSCLCCLSPASSCYSIPPPLSSPSSSLVCSSLFFSYLFSISFFNCPHDIANSIFFHGCKHATQGNHWLER